MDMTTTMAPGSGALEIRDAPPAPAIHIAGDGPRDRGARRAPRAAGSAAPDGRGPAEPIGFRLG